MYIYAWTILAKYRSFLITYFWILCKRTSVLLRKIDEVRLVRKVKNETHVRFWFWPCVHILHACKIIWVKALLNFPRPRPRKSWKLKILVARRRSTNQSYAVSRETVQQKFIGRVHEQAYSLTTRGVVSRVARRFTCKPKILICVYYGWPGNGKFCYNLWPFGISYGHLVPILYDPLVYFAVICYIFPHFGLFYQENLATLVVQTYLPMSN
jgi:hypothetical protein